MDSKQLTCHLCDKSYTLHNNLRRHMKLKHLRERVDPSNISVSNEKIEYLPSKIIKCPKCEFIMPHEDHKEKHMEVQHQSKPFKHKCYACLKPFHSDWELRKHSELMPTHFLQCLLTQILNHLYSSTHFQ